MTLFCRASGALDELKMTREPDFHMVGPMLDATQWNYLQRVLGIHSFIRPEPPTDQRAFFSGVFLHLGPLSSAHQQLVEKMAQALKWPSWEFIPATTVEELLAKLQNVRAHWFVAFGEKVHEALMSKTSGEGADHVSKSFAENFGRSVFWRNQKVLLTHSLDDLFSGDKVQEFKKETWNHFQAILRESSVVS